MYDCANRCYDTFGCMSFAWGAEGGAYQRMCRLYTKQRPSDPLEWTMQPSYADTVEASMGTPCAEPPPANCHVDEGFRYFDLNADFTDTEPSSQVIFGNTMKNLSVVQKTR